MNDWRDIHADQNLRLAQKMLEQQGELNALTKERDALKAAVEQIEIAFIIKWDGIRQRDPNDHDRGAAQVMEIVENVFAATLVAPEAPGDADVQA